MANYGYILDGWENKDLWILNNATWLNSDLQIGDGNSGGDAYREVSNTYNKNWYLDIYNCASSLGVNLFGVDFQIFLENDANPIIFRRRQCRLDYPPKNRVWYIIYDGVIKDQIAYDGGAYWLGCDAYYHDKIWREDSIYYYEPIETFILSFDYGSLKKPVKLKLATLEPTKRSQWRYPQWYYTEPTTEATEDYAFIM